MTKGLIELDTYRVAEVFRCCPQAGKNSPAVSSCMERQASTKCSEPAIREPLESVVLSALLAKCRQRAYVLQLVAQGREHSFPLWNVSVFQVGKAAMGCLFGNPQGLGDL